ncbi:MAG: hypothetical protein AAF483_01105, partial [Planctomycetota bacterium]
MNRLKLVTSGCVLLLAIHARTFAQISWPSPASTAAEQSPNQWEMPYQVEDLPPPTASRIPWPESSVENVNLGSALPQVPNEYRWLDKEAAVKTPHVVHLSTPNRVTSMVLPTVPPLFVPPGQRHPDGVFLDPYLGRSSLLAENSILDPLIAGQLGRIPSEFVPWWTSRVASSLNLKRQEMPIQLNALIQNALSHSPHIQLAAAETHIRRSRILEESAQFDWNSFLDTRYNDTNDPIGNTLTTGNNENRFKQQEWFARGGLRRKNRDGGELELSQRLGYLDNNSRFLIPPNQGSSRLELNYRH